MLDLSPGGVSFGCIKDRSIPEIWTLDIIDNTGVHLLDIPVETVWAGKNKNLKKSSIYETVVGAKFDCSKLSPEQKSALNHLLEFLRESNS